MAKRSYKNEESLKAAKAMPDPKIQDEWKMREARLEAIRLVYANSEIGSDVDDVLKEARAVAEFLANGT